MREIINDVDSWLEEKDTKIALATVINTWGSAPRKIGAKMAVTHDRRISGSVSGGCVEGAVIEAALTTLDSNTPQMLHFGVADEEAWEVGLACGGQIDVYVESLDRSAYQFAQRNIIENKPAYILTVIEGPDFGKKQLLALDQSNGISTEYPDLNLLEERIGQSRISHQARLETGATLFVDYLEPTPTLIIVGGVHAAITLASMAKLLNFSVILVDPRRAFANEERFGQVDILLQEWPQHAFEKIELSQDTAVVLLTHDPKIDDPALKVVLHSPVFYIGALGSKKTHSQRQVRLQKMGFDQQVISRIHAPIGMDIGANTPEEIALAILAEIVLCRHQIPKPLTE